MHFNFIILTKGEQTRQQIMESPPSPIRPNENNRLESGTTKQQRKRRHSVDIVHDEIQSD